MANRQPHLLVFIGMVCIFLLPQCAKDKKNTTIKKTGPAKIVRRRSKNEPRAREITRGLQTFKEVAAEDKRYKADDYEAKVQHGIVA